MSSFVPQAFTSDFRELRKYDISLSSKGLTFTAAPVKGSQLVWGGACAQRHKDREHFYFIILKQVVEREEWNKKQITSG
jgi:hypothetical protein